MTTQSGKVRIPLDVALIHDAIVAPLPARPSTPPGTVWVSVDVAGYHVSSQCSALVFGGRPAGQGPRPDPTRTTADEAEAAGMTMCSWCAAWRHMLTA